MRYYFYYEVIYMNSRQQIFQNLREFIKKIRTVDDYHEILESIFEMHFKHDKKDDLIKNLSAHIEEVFKINAELFFSYVRTDEYFNIEQLDLNSSKYKKTLELVNKLKMHYGAFLRPLFTRRQNPFLIVGAETNVTNNSSLHMLSLERADGEKFECLFSPDILMMIITALTNTLEKSMKDGIFNINGITLENYLKQSEKFKMFLDKLKKN